MLRVIDYEDQEIGDEISINKYKDLFLPLLKQIPSLEEALDQLYNSMNINDVKSQRNKVIKECKEKIEKNFEKIKKIHPNITKNEALIINTYTYEDSETKLSPYKILNNNLISDGKKNEIKNVYKYCFILLKALRQLTPFNANDIILYRALKEKVITEISKNKPNFIPYKEKNEKIFCGFASTFLKLPKNFNNLDTKTKFIIKGDIIGYDISPFTNFQEEKEVLLEPERKYKIDAVNELNETMNITCNILKTPLVLEDIIPPNKNKINNFDLKDIMKPIKNKINNFYYGNQINETPTNKISENENEINLKIKIDENNVGEKIYFLDNTYGKYYFETNVHKTSFFGFYSYDEKNKFVNHLHDNLKELNKNNTILIINDKKEPFKKFFTPKKIGIYSIKLIFQNKLIDCSYMFCDCENIIDIDVSKFNTQNIIDMKYMFSGCSSLTTLNLTSFNTENVTNMHCMFSECFNLKTLNLKSFKTEKVTEMLTMFRSCKSLTSLDLQSFNTKNVTNMESMFIFCKSLTKINLSSFNTQNVTNMKFMFNECSSLKTLNLSSFNTENVTDMKNMFHGCSNLMLLNLKSFKTEKVTDMSWMFYCCNSLISLNLESFNTENVTNMSKMFFQCYSLTTLNLQSFNTENVTEIAEIFSECYSLTKLNLSLFKSDKIPRYRMFYMFYKCLNLLSCNCSDKNFIDEFNNK